jgi:hypothetical protein
MLQTKRDTGAAIFADSKRAIIDAFDRYETVAWTGSGGTTDTVRDWAREYPAAKADD